MAKNIKLVAPLGLALIILFLGLSYFLPKDSFQQAKERLAKNPNDFEAHLMMAGEYLNHNQLAEAKKELLLAQKIEQPSELATQDVLGATTSKFEELWQKRKEEDPEEIKHLIDEWEKIIEFRPDYRDGYLRLALYHYKLFENDQAEVYLNKALELDPNFEPAREMEKSIF